MVELKVLSKKTIAVDVRPGESLLIINKKKKLAAESKITFQGKNIIDLAVENSKRINTTFISLIKAYLTSLNPIKTVGIQCFESISANSELSVQEAEVKLKKILNNLGCNNTETIFSTFPFKLEAYEKQRLMFALTFLIKPKLIVLDDTIFKIDTEIKDYILKELKKLKDENNSSLIFISKKIDIIDAAVDNIAIMYKGTVIEYGKMDLILEDPIHPYTRFLLSSGEGLDFSEKQFKIADYIENLNTIPRNGCSFCLNCKKASYDCIYMAPNIKTLSGGRQVIC